MYLLSGTPDQINKSINKTQNYKINKNFLNIITYIQQTEMVKKSFTHINPVPSPLIHKPREYCGFKQENVEINDRNKIKRIRNTG